MAVLHRFYCSTFVYVSIRRSRQTAQNEVNLLTFFYPSIVTFLLGVQKKLLFVTVLLSIHNINFDREIRKILFNTRAVQI